MAMHAESWCTSSLAPPQHQADFVSSDCASFCSIRTHHRTNSLAIALQEVKIRSRRCFQEPILGEGSRKHQPNITQQGLAAIAKSLDNQRSTLVHTRRLNTCFRFLFPAKHYVTRPQNLVLYHSHFSLLCYSQRWFGAGSVSRMLPTCNRCQPPPVQGYARATTLHVYQSFESCNRTAIFCPT
ncbi:hypothetical protein BDU57DRAFT_179720 [Ampelomyces quisqualis]|uniref:Uncharacterized protein n=1 Tax=Ampelomyces quisqualis TaxID=50730 RepID=A0A6A5QQ37_AMPQU|nr:hypothetical protein BDU57DRAFT_179720 [Ampelomyces quisqualis]